MECAATTDKLQRAEDRKHEQHAAHEPHDPTCDVKRADAHGCNSALSAMGTPVGSDSTAFMIASFTVGTE